MSHVGNSTDPHHLCCVLLQALDMSQLSMNSPCMSTPCSVRGKTWAATGGAGRHAAGAAAAPHGAAWGEEGREHLYSKSCLCSHSLSAATACKHPYGPNQAGDSRHLPAVEVPVPQFNPTLAVTILLLTTTTLPGLSAELLVHASPGPLEPK